MRVKAKRFKVFKNGLQEEILALRGEPGIGGEGTDLSMYALKSEIPDISGKQDIITDIGTIRAGAALGATALQEHQDISGKQDVIEDLEAIRGGSALANGIPGCIAWDASVSYVLGAFAVYDDKVWRAKAANKGVTPSEGTYWARASIYDLYQQMMYPTAQGLSGNMQSVNVSNLGLMKVGKTVVISGYITVTGTVSSGAAFARVPEAYAPVGGTAVGYWYITATGTSTNKTFYANISASDRYIRLYNNNSNTDGTYIINGTWITN